MVRIVAVIPARMGSSRFPGKPLAPLLGRPMIEHVVQRTRMCERLEAVYVATCDDEIRNVVAGFGGQVIMTSAAHERAGDRVAEAVEVIEAGAGGSFHGSDIVVMIQGDEPMITAEMIEAAFTPMLSDETVSCVNLVRRIRTVADFVDPNTIKVVMNSAGDALYFSRASVPSITRMKDLPSSLAGGLPLEFSSESSAVFKQVCVIPFRRNFLHEFARLSPTPLEQAESIDMLRVLEHGGRVRLVETDIDTHAVDTPDDLRLVEALMKDDPLRLRYVLHGASGNRR